MNHHDHVALIKEGVVNGTWADLGAGTGAFTLALADCLGAGGVIYAVDKDRRALDEQKRIMQRDFPTITTHYMTADFTRKLDLPMLDGIVMANSLHFHREKNSVLQLVRSYLKPNGRLILVEYNTDKGNTWVPYPLSFGAWEKLAQQNGFLQTKLLNAYPSRFLGEIFSAVSYLREPSASLL
jgi:SAM-dependent methyltransferase